MEITARNVDRLQHVAVSRLTLFVAGRIHALIEPFQRWLADEVRQTALDDGLLDTGKAWQVLAAAEPRWREVMRRFAALLTAARVQAADVAFSSLRTKNNARLRVWRQKGAQEIAQVSLAESYQPLASDYLQLVRMWVQRREWALRVAQERVIGDGLSLSTRVWRLEQGGMQAIRQVLATGMAERTSAWELAQRLEESLGANQDFPRWTRQRLFGLSPQERVADMSGLRRAGDVLQPWQARGVSYNALRLARNEIQIANHAMTSEIARNFPGIVGRKSRLSPSHPKVDICDEYAAGGPYAVTENFLPLHVNCLCFYEEVLMPQKEFNAALRGWIAGENEFLDGYAAWLDQRAVGPWPAAMDAAGLAEVWNALERWLNGDVDTAAAALMM